MGEKKRRSPSPSFREREEFAGELTPHLAGAGDPPIRAGLPTPKREQTPERTPGIWTLEDRSSRR